MSNQKDAPLRCSFCGKTQDEVKKIIAGPGVYICDECIELCNDIMEEEWQRERAMDDSEQVLLKPADIKDVLDNYVIGQQFAKRILSVAVHNHYKRIHANLHDSDVELQKSNILLIGPTGTGKTLLAQTLAKILNVPFAMTDATTLTEAGYVGEDVENIVLKLLQAADYDTERAEQGIIYIDEIDKITRKSDNPSITRDVSGEGVQQALLKIIEGTIASIPPKGGRKHPEQSLIQIDTSNILFICGGSFSGLENIVSRRIGKGELGFGTVEKEKRKNVNSIFDDVRQEDLINFGLIPELVGRLPIISSLDILDEEDMLKVLLEPKNSIIKQYQKLFLIEGIVLEFQSSALKAVVKLAMHKKAGARALRSVIEESLMEIMYCIPDMEGVERVTITKDVILHGKEPVYDSGKKRKSA